MNRRILWVCSAPGLVLLVQCSTAAATKSDVDAQSADVPALDAVADGAADVASDVAAIDSSADVSGVNDTQSLDITGDLQQADGSVDASVDVSALVPLWTQFEVNKGAGPCPPDMVCTWKWHLDTAGHVTTSKQGVSGAATLSAAHWATIQTLLATQEFLTGMAKGFVCGEPPTDVGISFVLSLSGQQFQQDVTGCVFGQPATNLPQQINDILAQY